MTSSDKARDDSAGTEWEYDAFVTIHNRPRRRQAGDVYELAEARIHADDRAGVLHIRVTAIAQEWEQASAEQRAAMEGRARRTRDAAVRLHRSLVRWLKEGKAIDIPWNSFLADAIP